MRPLTGYRRKLRDSGRMLLRVDRAASDVRSPVPPANAKKPPGITAYLGTPYQWSEVVKVRARRGGATPRIIWSFRNRVVRAAAHRDGKYVLLCTDLRLPTDEVVSSSYGRASSRGPSGP